jgi:hypothetical protein
MPGRRFESFASADTPPERPADPAVRKANSSACTLSRKFD